MGRGGGGRGCRNGWGHGVSRLLQGYINVSRALDLTTERRSLFYDASSNICSGLNISVFFPGGGRGWEGGVRGGRWGFLADGCSRN